MYIATKPRKIGFHQWHYTQYITVYDLYNVVITFTQTAEIGNISVQRGIIFSLELFIMITQILNNLSHSIIWQSTCPPIQLAGMSQSKKHTSSVCNIKDPWAIIPLWYPDCWQHPVIWCRVLRVGRGGVLWRSAYYDAYLLAHCPMIIFRWFSARL